MVLPLILGALGGTLGGAGMLGGLGALGGAAVGSGLGGFAETGDIETGILTGLGAFAGGALLGPMMGGAGSGAASSAGGTVSSIAPQLQAATSGATGGAGIAGLGKDALNFAKSGMGIGSNIGGAMGASFVMPEGEDNTKSKSKYADTPGAALYASPPPPPPGYSPGVDPEYSYANPRLPSADEILAFRTQGTRPTGFYGGGMIRSLENTFGPIKLAEGGIAELMQDDPSLGEPNEKEVVVEAVKAIKGESDSPEIALARFLTEYGEDALRDLVDRVQSGEMDETVARGEGKLRGPGDGMDDLIPATIEGEQDVLLSDGEFVVPADVVSGLGNGSSDAGARALDEMMSRVREARNGSPEQPPQVPQEEVMPA
jgi:hypothetical protein